MMSELLICISGFPDAYVISVSDSKYYIIMFVQPNIFSFFLLLDTVIEDKSPYNIYIAIPDFIREIFPHFLFSPDQFLSGADQPN